MLAPSFRKLVGSRYGNSRASRWCAPRRQAGQKDSGGSWKHVLCHFTRRKVIFSFPTLGQLLTTRLIDNLRMKIARVRFRVGELPSEAVRRAGLWSCRKLRHPREAGGDEQPELEQRPSGGRSPSPKCTELAATHR